MQIVVDGLLTNYQTIGDKNKPPLLILHGWKRLLTEWLPVATQISDKYFVILLDLPGFGQTAKPESAYSIYDYATFVEHFLDKVNIRKTILLGHSFGGRIGIILASNTKTIKKLILVDSGAIEIKSMSVRIRILLNKILAYPIKVFLPDELEKLKSRVGSSDYQSAGTMRDIFVKTVNKDLSPLLPKITIPTLIIWGERDSVIPISDGTFMKSKIASARFRVVWGAGHSPYLEKPREFMEILQENI